MTHSDVQRGVSLALIAHRRGLLDDPTLALLLAYYNEEGASRPLPPEEVLERLGGVSLDQLAALPHDAPDAGGEPFNDRLTLLGILGQGGMGAVYRAYDRVLRRIVAVKKIRPDRLDGPAAERLLSRFQREAEVMARVRHPACVAIHDAGIAPDGSPFLVMEFVAGHPLSSVLNEAREAGRALEPKRVARWGKAIAEALQACHDGGVVHRDVKPGNVLLDEHDQVHLTDFGIALDAEAHTKLTAELAAVGTLAYMPPEQAGGGAADARSDVYALGATLYEALTGETVFEAALAMALLPKILSERPTSPTDHRPDLHPDLATVVLKCLEKDPPDRYPSAQALANDLARYLADQPVEARPISGLARVGRRLWRRRKVVGAGLLLLLALVGGAIGLNLRQAEATLQAALTDDDLDAAEASFSSLRDHWRSPVAERALEGLRHVAARRDLRRATAAFGEYRAHGERLTRLSAELRTLKAKVGKTVPLSAPVASTPVKQAIFQLEDQRQETARAREQAFRRAERLLARAALGLSGPSLEQLRATVYLARARELEQRDPAASAKAYALAKAADTASGDRRAAEVAPGTLTVRSTPPASRQLHRYRYDPVRGYQVKALVGPLTDDPLSLETGDYLAEIKSPGWLPVRYPIAIRPGIQRKLDVSLIKQGELGPLAQRVVHILGGTGEFTDTQEPYSVEDHLLSRTELTSAAWLSCALAEDYPPHYFPIVDTKRTDAGWLLRNGHAPCGGLSHEHATAYLKWLQTELDLAAIPLEARLPALRTLYWATAGELRWLFPWGNRIDHSFYRPTNRTNLPVSSFPIDRSPFGVHDLVGGLLELSTDQDKYLSTSERPIFRHFGGSAMSSVPFVTQTFRLPSTPLSSARHDRTGQMVGFRVMFTPRRAPAQAFEPKQAQAWAAKAKHEATGGRFPEAQRLALKALQANARDARLWLLRGKIRLGRNDRWGAWWDLTQALCLEPQLREALELRGRVYLSNKRWQEAEADFTQLLALTPKHPGALLRRAEAKAGRAAYAEAVADLEDLLASAPQGRPELARAQVLLRRYQESARTGKAPDGW